MSSQGTDEGVGEEVEVSGYPPLAAPPCCPICSLAIPLLSAPFLSQPHPLKGPVFSLPELTIATPNPAKTNMLMGSVPGDYILILSFWRRPSLWAYSINGFSGWVRCNHVVGPTLYPLPYNEELAGQVEKGTKS